MAGIANANKTIGENALVTYHANSPMLAGVFRRAFRRGHPDHFPEHKVVRRPDVAIPFMPNGTACEERKAEFGE
jgi:hypothetical protein